MAKAGAQFLRFAVTGVIGLVADVGALYTALALGAGPVVSDRPGRTGLPDGGRLPRLQRHPVRTDRRARRALVFLMLFTDPSALWPRWRPFSGIFMEKMVGFVKLYFPVFMLGAVFGKVIELSGFSNRSCRRRSATSAVRARMP
jgi:hypothetical protein